MKTECFYNHSIEELSLDELKTYLSNYIQWYNNDRIKNTLGGLSPYNTGSDLVSISKGVQDFVRIPLSILNTIETQLSNARVEAINNKIKLFLRKAYGFRNIQNMLDMILLGCSNIFIPLTNRGGKWLKVA